MPVRFGLSARRAGMTIEDCQRYWRGPHAEIFRQVPGLISYVQNHALTSGGETLLPHAGFDICAEVEFATSAELAEAVASDYYRDRVLPDEPAFLDATGRRFLTTRRTVIRAGGDLTGAVKLITFVNSRHSPVPTARDALRHVRYDPVPPGGDSGAVEQLWFGSTADALAYCRSDDLDPAASRPVLVREHVVVAGPDR